MEVAMSELTAIERRLRMCGLLVLAGLLLSLFSLWWPHPLAFMMFAFAAAPLTFLGILAYLYAVVKQAA